MELTLPLFLGIYWFGMFGGVLLAKYVFKWIPKPKEEQINWEANEMTERKRVIEKAALVCTIFFILEISKYSSDTIWFYLSGVGFLISAIIFCFINKKNDGRNKLLE